MEKLSETQIAESLKGTPGWECKGEEITRLWKFLDFKQAMEFANRVAELAEATDHHPDIDIRYNKVRLTLSTHSAGGLTEKDFSLAKQIG